MRKAVEQIRRGKPTWRASSSTARASVARRRLAQPQDRIGDRARRGETRIEAVGRILEHHLDALAQRRARELLRPACAPISSPSKMMLPAVCVDQPHHHHRGGGLAAAGFADEADALAAH